MKAAKIESLASAVARYRVTVKGQEPQDFLHLAEALEAAGWRTQALKAIDRLKDLEEQSLAARTVTLHKLGQCWRVSHPTERRRRLPLQTLPEALETLAGYHADGMRVTLDSDASIAITHHRLRPSDITQASAETLRTIAASLATGDNPHLRSPTP